MMAARTALTVLVVYLGAGFLFTFWLMMAGLARLDSNAKGASLGVRVILLPGAVALWPVLAWKLLRSARA